MRYCYAATRHPTVRTVTMLRKLFLAYLCALMWVSCLLPGTQGGRWLSTIVGDVVVWKAPGLLGSCHSDLRLFNESVCWPYIWQGLRYNEITSTCSERNGSVNWQSEVVACEYKTSVHRYECQVSLSQKERALYVGLKMDSTGHIAGYTDLHCQYKRAPNENGYQVAVLHSRGGRRLDDRVNQTLPFSVDVMCNQEQRCDIHNVKVLLLKCACGL